MDETQKWFYHDTLGAHVLSSDGDNYRADVTPTALDVVDTGTGHTVASFGKDGVRFDAGYDQTIGSDDAYVRFHADTDELEIRAKSVVIGSTDVTDAITDARATADKAQTTADTAKSTADSAKAAAGSAQSTADAAKSAARAAQSSADAAQGTADDAWARTLRVEVMSAPADAAGDTSLLTAYAFRGGELLSDEAVAKMGLLAWYVGGSRVATGSTYTCAAGTAAECRLEG